MGWSRQPKAFSEVNFGAHPPKDYYFDPDLIAYYSEYFQSVENSCLILYLDSIVGWLAMAQRSDCLDYHGFPVRFHFFSAPENVPPGLDEYLLSVLRDSAQGKQIRILWNDVHFLFSKKINLSEKLFSYIDLKKDEPTILQDVRGSYRSLINKGRREIDLQISAEDTSWESFSEAKRFHEKVAGRQTRSDLTWKLQHELLLKSKAFLLRGSLNGALVSLTYVTHANQEAFYGFGVYDRELMHAKVSLSHWPLVAAIFHAKKMGLNYFNLGDVGPDFPTTKEENIALFKRGFSSDLRKEIVWTIN